MRCLGTESDLGSDPTGSEPCRSLVSSISRGNTDTLSLVYVPSCRGGGRREGEKKGHAIELPIAIGPIAFCGAALAPCAWCTCPAAGQDRGNGGVPKQGGPAACCMVLAAAGRGGRSLRCQASSGHQGSFLSLSLARARRCRGLPVGALGPFFPCLKSPAQGPFLAPPSPERKTLPWNPHSPRSSTLPCAPPSPQPQGPRAAARRQSLRAFPLTGPGLTCRISSEERR